MGLRTTAVLLAFTAGASPPAHAADGPKAPAGTPIAFDLPKPAAVSLAVFDPAGRQLRTLFSGRKLDAGKHSFTWDGIDRWGDAAPAGEYEWRLVAGEGLEATFVGAAGGKPGWEPWLGFLANHGGPSTLALNTDGNLAVAHDTVEGGWGVVLAAGRTGAGLLAEFFAGDKFDGEPVHTRTDARLMFGPLNRAFGYTKGPPWFGKGETAVPAPHVVRWTGEVEPLFAEEYQFAVEVAGRKTDPAGSRVRLWIDGKLVVDRWDGVKPVAADIPRQPTGLYRTPPLAMTPGRRVSVRLEFDANGTAEPHLHLLWESPTQER